MGGKQHKGQKPGRGSEAQAHHRPGDPAHPQPGRPSREQSQREQSQKQGQGQGRKETERRPEDDLLREEDLHDENL
ncbi:hypothetical protein [Streptomyces sp. A0592]|uniref:hypothetical protein n=1 Tax=Streptomyces TaxID=1883 RepID=UPI00109E4878|nr:hypothetical protein [Streptomyces sp. A0592]THA77296.1 hypothetical protein E6U81_34420 [Streptomyces sp. A0592]WSR81493.1 hypothetical protein OG489_01795 [Streptomyces erythrochromogenes]